MLLKNAEGQNKKGSSTLRAAGKDDKTVASQMNGSWTKSFQMDK